MQVSVAYLAVLLIWSTTPLGIVWSSESINPTMAVLLRMVIAVVLGSMIIFIRKIELPWHKQAIRLYAFSALGIFGGMSFSYLAAGYLSSGILSLVFGLAPAFSAILARRILAEPKISTAKKLSMLLSFIGLGFVCADNFSLTGDSIYGFGFVLIAVFLFSLSGVLVKSISLAIHPMATTVGALSLSLPLFIANWLLLDGSFDTSEWQLRSIWATVYLGVFGSLIGFFAYFFVLQRLTASTVALITLITPVIALTLGAVLNDEVIHPQLVFGALLVILGLTIYHWGELLYRKIKVSLRVPTWSNEE
ncbi:DMT family transporter [Colwellia sp. MSW7]|jgi:drug/metabolite transporter (DMT)-like permease|uniref:DMT family transporter n=1 Tax=Colwellia maritima TaxID=2912588 RepID=A0ABS9X219_9GAMM|nr:DMT family transporter [Colwellia maritima]MCI2284285.1 DMT family transporter [Colwellia maritima]